jgi:hypothetical protein
MCPYIKQITSRLGTFVSGLESKDARFAIAVFGGPPTLLLPFTSDSVLTKKTLAEIPCTYPGQEAGLEAIRMALKPNNGSDMVKSCVAGSATCSLIWRTTNVTKSIIMATDEDSDLPTNR